MIGANNMDSLFDTVQAGEYLNTPPTSLVTWRCTKRVNIPFVRIGGNIRYKRSDLDAFIAANTHGSVVESEAA